MGQPDSQELDLLVAEHHTALRRLATRLTGSVEASEEIMQETLLRIVRGWRRFEGKASFKTWAITILLNVFRNWIAQQRDVLPLEDMPDVRQSDPATNAMEQELGRIVAHRVSTLPPRQREVLILLVYEGLAPKEVGQLLHMQLANVYSNLYQARQRLRRELAPFLGNNANNSEVCGRTNKEFDEEYNA